MQKETFKPLIGRLAGLCDSIERRDEELAEFIECCCNARIPFDQWKFFVNNEKKVIVALSPDGKEYKRKPAAGDKFDPYTGIALAIFENHTGITYQQLNRCLSLFAKRTKTQDPALTFIRMFVAEGTGFTEEKMNAMMADCVEKNGNIVLTANIPVFTVTLSCEDSEPEEPRNIQNADRTTGDEILDILLSPLRF